MYITKEHLKPGMVLAEDLVLYNQNISTVLLVKGQKLNTHYINKILFHDIPGAYIINEAFDDLIFQPGINNKLESKALRQLRNVYTEIEENDTITANSIDKFSEIVDELISEISVKRELNNNIMEFRNHDEYTYQHCLSVANLSITTGIAMGLTKQELHDIGMAGFLHDIGKTLIPTEIINKPGKLTYEEYELMKTHPLVAVSMLENLVSSEILDAIQCHHEKMDGTGYPYGIARDNIPMYGKLLAICDVYHALTSDRSYRKTCFSNEVMEYLMGNADTHFDYEILKIFLKNVVAFPVGTFVMLSDGGIAVVVKNNIENNMRPIVRLINPDNTVGKDIDLLNNYKYMNVTIVDSGYNCRDIDFGMIKLA